MSYFKTESTNSSLQVLIIAEDGQAANLIKKLIRDKGLEAIKTSPQTFVENKQLQEKSLSEDFYRIVWVAGFKKPSYELVKEVAKPLQNNGERLIVLSKTITAVENTSPLLSDWSFAAENLKRINRHIKQNIEKCSVFTAKDLVGSDWFSQPLKTILKAYRHSVLVNPNLDLNFQTEADFIHAISSRFFKPGSSNYLAVGSQTPSTQVCQAIQQLVSTYYQKQLQIKLISAQVRKQGFKNNLQVLRVNNDIKQIVDLKVRQLAKLSQKMSPEEKSALTLPSLPAEPEIKLKSTQSKQLSQNKNELTAQKSEKNTRLKVAEKKEQVKVIRNEKATLKRKNKLDVDSELTRIFKQQRVDEKIDRRVEKAEIISKIKHKIKHKKAVFGVGLVLFLIGLVVGGNFLLLLTNLNDAKKELATLVEKQAQLNRQANQGFSQPPTQTPPEKLLVLQNQAKITSQLLPLSMAEDAQRVVANYKLIQDYLFKKSSYQRTNAELISLIWGESAEDFDQLTSSLSQQTDEVYKNIGLIQERLGSDSPMGLSPEDRKQVDAFLMQVANLKERVVENQALFKTLPNLLAKDEKKTYWIVIQDNQELRPTGGFPQTLIEVTLENGIVIDKKAISVNQVDQQLLGKVEAPSEIKRFLGEEYLYLRDANWDPDFPSSSQTMSWFIRESLNEPVDGIIGTNYFLIQDILQVLGPTLLPEYEEEVDGKNLYERLRQHAVEEKDQASENFHTALIKALLEKLDAAGTEEKYAVFKEIRESIDKKQTLVTFSDQSLNSSIESLGWSGSIILPNCPMKFSQSGSCSLNSVYQVESNVGINKVNPYVERRVNHSLNIDGKQIKHQREISFDNTAFSSTWPLGEYRSYVRFYLNPEASNIKLSVDGKTISNNDTITYSEHNRLVVGALVVVPAQAGSQLVLEYSSPLDLNQTESLLFFDQKQPGVVYQEKGIVINYDDNILSPTLVAPTAIVESGSLVFNQLGQDHAYIGVKFKETN